MASSKRSAWSFYKRDIKTAKIIVDTFITNVDNGQINPGSESNYQNAVRASNAMGCELTRLSNKTPKTLGKFDFNPDPESQQSAVMKRQERVQEKQRQTQLDMELPQGFNPFRR